VLAVERVSALHLAAVQTLTGARVLSGLPASPAPELELRAAAGVLQRVSLLRVAGGRPFLRLAGPLESSGPRLCTLVLCGRDQLALAETQLACEQVLKLLRAFAQEPVVLAGRGAAEMAMARAVRAQSARWAADQQRRALERRQLQSESEREHEHQHEHSNGEMGEDGTWARQLCAALELLADSLEGLAAALQPLSGRVGALSARDVLEALRAAPPPAGWDPVRECAQPAGLGPADVLDSCPAKLSALSIATEAANVLLRIKGVVRA
jgi:chaperonin GroEL (HSP60 family)